MNGDNDDSAESFEEELQNKHDTTVSKGMSKQSVSAPSFDKGSPKIFNEAGHRRQVTTALKRLHALLLNIEDINKNEAIDLESWYRIMIAQFHELGVTSEEFATRFAATGINFNLASKRAAADKLQVHPHTLDRRLKEERFRGIRPED